MALTYSIVEGENLLPEPAAHRDQADQPGAEQEHRAGLGDGGVEAGLLRIRGCRLARGALVYSCLKEAILGHEAMAVIGGVVAGCRDEHISRARPTISISGD